MYTNLLSVSLVCGCHTVLYLIFYRSLPVADVTVTFVPHPTVDIDQTRRCVCVRVCMRACVHACVRACVYACACIIMHSNSHIYMYIHFNGISISSIALTWKSRPVLMDWEWHRA